MTPHAPIRALALLGLVGSLAACGEIGAVAGLVGRVVEKPVEVEQVADAYAPLAVAPGERVEVRLMVAFPNECGRVGQARAIVDEAARKVTFRVERYDQGMNCETRARVVPVTTSFTAGEAGVYALDLLVAPVRVKTNPYFMPAVAGPTPGPVPSPVNAPWLIGALLRGGGDVVVIEPSATPTPFGASPSPTASPSSAPDRPAATPGPAVRTTLYVTVVAPTPAPTAASPSAAASPAP